MRIAVAVNNDDENIFWHFGHCERFKLYDVEAGNIQSTSYISVYGGHGPQRLQAMVSNKADVVLTDGIGPGMAQAAPQFQLSVVAGVKGDADSAVHKFLSGELTHDPEAVRPCGQD